MRNVRTDSTAFPTASLPVSETRSARHPGRILVSTAHGNDAEDSAASVPNRNSPLRTLPPSTNCSATAQTLEIAVDVTLPTRMVTAAFVSPRTNAVLPSTATSTASRSQEEMDTRRIVPSNG